QGSSGTLAAFGDHTQTAFVAPAASKSLWIRRHAVTNLDGPFGMFAAPECGNQLPFISQPKRRNTGTASCLLPAARCRLSESYRPLLMSARLVPCHVTGGILPPATAHCSRPLGKTSVQP